MDEQKCNCAVFAPRPLPPHRAPSPPVNKVWGHLSERTTMANQTPNQLIQWQVEELDRTTKAALSDISKSLKEISSSLHDLAVISTTGMAKQQAEIEEMRNGIERAFVEIGKTNAKLDDVNKINQLIQQQIPLLMMSHRWVIGGMIGVVSIVGLTIIKIVISK